MRSAVRWFVGAGVATALLLAGCGSSTPSSTSSDSSSRETSEVQSEGQSVASGSGGGAEGACTSASSSTVSEGEVSAELPEGIELPSGAVVTEVRSGRITGRASGDVGEVLRGFRSKLEASGATIVAADNEDREAELSFKTSGGDEGEVRLNRSACAAGTTTFVILADD